MADILVGYYQNEIVLTLQNLTKDRVHKVQIAANETLKDWLIWKNYIKKSKIKKCR